MSLYPWFIRVHPWLILFSLVPITKHNQKRLDSRLRGNDEFGLVPYDGVRVAFPTIKPTFELIVLGTSRRQSAKRAVYEVSGLPIESWQQGENGFTEGCGADAVALMLTIKRPVKARCDLLYRLANF